MAERRSGTEGATMLGPSGTPQERRLKVAAWALGILVALALLWVLHSTMWVTMPLVASLFIAVGIWPLTAKVQSWVPKRLSWLGYVAAMTLILLALALFFLGIWYAATTVADQWPQYEDEFQRSWRRVSEWIAGLSNGAGVGGASGEAGGAAAAGNGDSGGESGGQGALEPGPALGFVSDYALTIVRSIWEVVAVLVLIFFLVLLMLVEGRVWKDKLIEATRSDSTDEWLLVADDMGRRFRRYLAVRGLVGLITGALYAGWLWAWGVDFVIVWFLLAFLLNFVPTLGSLIAGGLAAAFAFLQMTPGTALIVALGILAIEQVTGNYIDPRLQGRQLSISPMITMFMLLVWGWVWGVAGALLAVPITVLLMMVFARFPPLVPISLLLSGERSREALFRMVRQS